MEGLRSVLPLWKLQVIEFLFAAGFTVLLWIVYQEAKPPKAATHFHAVRRFFRKWARRKILAVSSVALLVLTLRAALIPLLGKPQPRFADEYSYLLAGKTFALGRLTNPSHPMWVHFETFQVIHQPTYSSMYPPAQGIVLALGILAGHPWIGVWLVTSLACAAICWMLQGWVPPEWALFGGLIAAIRLGVLSFWMNSYFATSISALGGALVLGALPRLKKNTRTRDAVIMAIGLAILANSRPYEGMLLSVPVVVALLTWLVRKRGYAAVTALQRILLPMALILAVTVGPMMLYFWRVTGNPVEMPYQVNRATYAVAPYFIWQELRPTPAYHHADMRDYYSNVEVKDFLQAQTLRGFANRTLEKILSSWGFYLGPALSIPLWGFGCILHDRKMRFPLCAAVFLFAGTLVETWTMPLYIAPATSLIYLILIQCARHIHLWKWNGIALGQSLVGAIFPTCLAIMILRLALIPTSFKLEPPWPRGNLDRAQVLDQLNHADGDHLVIVREPPIWSEVEWVANDPDIDHSKVVWARDMGTRDNSELLQYFSQRTVWLVNLRNGRPHLDSYSADKDQQ